MSIINYLAIGVKAEGACGQDQGNRSHGIWITGDGFRIAAICLNAADNSGLCRDDSTAVHRLPPPWHSHAAEGAGFFD